MKCRLCLDGYMRPIRKLTERVTLWGCNNPECFNYHAPQHFKCPMPRVSEEELDNL